MRIDRRAFVLAAIALAVLAGWSSIRPGQQEIAVLRVFDGQGKDYFASLRVVDDASGFAWIRADRRDAGWLSAVEANPHVWLQRRGRSFAYVATVYDTPEARAYVGPRFRAKYGIAEGWREWRGARVTVPVRLQKR